MIYLLAQGKGSRWREGTRPGTSPTVPCEYKQLIEISEEPNLFRTIRIIDEFGRDDYVVVAEDVVLSPDALPDRLITLECPGNILDGISQLLFMKSDDSIFLLGDVIFSRAALKAILSYTETGYTLWGRTGRNEFTGKAAGEIFALTACQAFALRAAEQLRYLKVLEEKLWGFYHSAVFSGSWIEISDWTDDLDSPEGYKEFYEKLNELAINDDKGEKI